jgi:uncharacterized protein (DUF58 family)
MIFAQRFYLILALSILLSIASLWVPEIATLSLLITILLLAAALADLFLTPRQPLSIERKVGAILIQGHPQIITLEVRNRSALRLPLQIKDSLPAAFLYEGDGQTLQLQPLSHTSLTTTVVSYQRGEFHFGDIYYRTTGPLGLVQRQETISAPLTVYVFPDISPEGARDLNLHVGDSRLIGHRPNPWSGQGREFESLRDFQRDDDFRNIDWKASAKHSKFIVRQYQTERDQRLVLMIDLGRLMSSKIGHYTKLDYAINAAVRLAQMAIYKGDWVGLLLFSHDIAYYLPPHKGRAQMTSIIQALVKAQPRRLEPNYPLVFNYAARRNTRRTLFVCFTDLLDLEISQSLVTGIQHLLPRHLAMTVTVSDSELLQATKTLPETGLEVYQHVAAQEVWNDYQRSIRALHTRGILTVNVPAQDLTLATLNRYLEIKRTARL